MNKRIISLILSIVMVLLIIPPATYTAQAADFESQLRSKGFSESYIPSLLTLHNKYPKWNFEALIVGENFSTAVSKERQNGGHAQQRIQQYSGNDGKGYYCTCASCYVNGKYVVRENPNWVAASQSAVEYYLDPRNFLDEKYIFQFESTEYKSSHTQAGVETILAGTFMANTNITYKDASGKTQTYGGGVKYSKAIMDAAKDNKISAYYIAAKIVQEVGGKTMSAGGVSGTNSPYLGIYNFYNIGANTGALDGLKWAYGDYRWIHVTYNGKSGYIREDLVDNKTAGWYTNTQCNLRKGPSTSTDSLGLIPNNTKVTYIETVVSSDKDTYNRPWTNPYLSIYNGAKWIANNFGGTQFTGYLQKFNVNPASGSSMHGHEYMTNVQGAASEGANAYNAYKNANLLNSEITFTIPVFENMPAGSKYFETPKLTSITAENSGTVITWNKVAGAENYRVFRKTGSGSWVGLRNTTATSYTDKTAAKGTTYDYTVRCITKDGTTYTSDFDRTGLSLKAVANPAISSVSTTATGISISWGKVTGADSYRVFYRIGSSSWTKIADTTATSYSWNGAKGGTNYTFTVRCVTKDGKSYSSGFDNTGKSIKFLSTPKLTSVSAENSGTLITWEKVAGAENYRVFRKTGNGSWVGLGNTTATSYTDKTAAKGTSYAYTVRCITKDGKTYVSGFDNTGKGITSSSTPKLTSVANGPYGIQITWGAVSGAQKYRVFYRIGSGAWTKIADTTATTYAWLGPVSGTNYTFTVRCINSAGNVYTSGFDSVGKSIKYIAAPKISSVDPTSTGIQINWGKVAGAALYRVYYKTDSGVWTKIADTTGASYHWTGAKSGTNYTFTVRCLTSDGKSFTSGYNPIGKSIKYIATPKLSSVAVTASGIQINWGAVKGAELYRVFYRIGSGAWVKIVDTKSTSYTWNGATIGTNYIFTVRCVSGDGKSYTSYFDSVGKNVTFLSTPKLTSISVENSGTLISWDKVSGAENYRVFRKTGNGSWVGLGNTTATSYTDKTAAKGTSYAYTVRCVTKDGSTYASDFNRTGLSIKAVATPVLSAPSTSANGITINWGKVDGAELYRVFYRTGSGAWTKIVDTTSTSYTWTEAKSGTKYTFTVRCLSSDAKRYVSGFDSAGKSITK